MKFRGKIFAVFALAFFLTIFSQSADAILFNASLINITMEVDKDTAMRSAEPDENFGTSTGIDIETNIVPEIIKTGVMAFNTTKSLSPKHITGARLTVASDFDNTGDTWFAIKPLLRDDFSEFEATWIVYKGNNSLGNGSNWTVAGGQGTNSDHNATTSTWTLVDGAVDDFFNITMDLRTINASIIDNKIYFYFDEFNFTASQRFSFRTKEGAVETPVLLIETTDTSLGLISPINNATTPISESSTGREFIDLKFQTSGTPEGIVTISIDDTVVEFYEIDTDAVTNTTHRHFFDTYGSISAGQHNWTAHFEDNSGNVIGEVSTEFFVIDGEGFLFLFEPVGTTIAPTNTSGNLTIDFKFRYTTDNAGTWKAFLFVDNAPFTQNPISLVTSATQNITKIVTYNYTRDGALFDGVHTWEVSLAKCDNAECTLLTNIDTDISNFTLVNSSASDLGFGNDIITLIDPTSNELVAPRVVLQDGSGNHTGIFFTWGYNNKTFPSTVELFVDGTSRANITTNEEGTFSESFTFIFDEHGNLTEGQHSWFVKLRDSTILQQQSLVFTTGIETFRISQSSSELVSQFDLILLSPIGFVEPFINNATNSQALNFSYRWRANDDTQHLLTVRDLESGDLVFEEGLTAFSTQNTQTLRTFILDWSTTGGLPDGQYEWTVSVVDSQFRFVGQETEHFNLTGSTSTGAITGSRSGSLPRQLAELINELLGLNENSTAGLNVLALVITAGAVIGIAVKTQNPIILVSVLFSGLFFFILIGWLPTLLLILLILIAGGIVVKFGTGLFTGGSR